MLLITIMDDTIDLYLTPLKPSEKRKGLMSSPDIESIQLFKCGRQFSPDGMLNSPKQSVDEKLDVIMMSIDSLKKTSASQNDIISLKQNFDLRLDFKFAQQSRLIESLQSENTELSIKIETLNQKQIYLENRLGDFEKLQYKRDCIFDKQIIEAKTEANNVAQYTRRQNLRFYGLPVIEKENTLMYIHNLICSALNENFPISEIAIAHRLPIPHGVRRDIPAIIVRFRSKEGKDYILRRSRHFYNPRRGFSVRVNEDLTPTNSDLFRRAKAHASVKETMTHNGNVRIITQDERKIQLNPFINLNIQICPPQNVRKEAQENEMEVQDTETGNQSSTLSTIYKDNFPDCQMRTENHREKTLEKQITVASAINIQDNRPWRHYEDEDNDGRNSLLLGTALVHRNPTNSWLNPPHLLDKPIMSSTMSHSQFMNYLETDACLNI